MNRLRSILLPPPPSNRASLGLLVLRAVAGGVLMTHGWGRIQDPFHWLDNAASPPPAVFQFLAAVAEFFGGLGLIVGLLTVAGFYDHLVAFNAHMGEVGFVRENHRGIMIVRNNLDALLDAMADYVPHRTIFAMKAENL